MNGGGEFRQRLSFCFIHTAEAYWIVSAAVAKITAAIESMNMI